MVYEFFQSGHKLRTRLMDGQFLYNMQEEYGRGRDALVVHLLLMNKKARHSPVLQTLHSSEIS